MRFKKKSILSMLLVLLLMTALLPTSAFAAGTLQGDTNKNGTVDVTLTITNGIDDYYASNTGDRFYVRELNVPYFDLALYGLEEYYYNPDCYTGSYQQAGTAATAKGVVTAMHVFVYATEIFMCGYDEVDAGKGHGKETIGNFISWSQGAGSSYMKFWNGSENLNYFLNYEYPLGREGWGSTSDQQAMEDGTAINVHLISSQSATGSNYGFFEYGDGVRDRTSITVGEELPLTLYSTITSFGNATPTKILSGVNVYYISEDYYGGEPVGKWTLLGSTDENGQITIPGTLEAGRYYISAMGEDGGYQRGAAAFVLTVKKDLKDLKLADGNGDGVINSADAVLSLRYAAGTLGQADFYSEAADVNGDGVVNSADAVLILRYAAGIINKFPVE